MSLTVGLINPPADASNHGVCIPLNLTVVSAALKEKGYNTIIIDLNLYAYLDPSEFFTDIVEHSLKIISSYNKKCDIFGFSTYCNSYAAMILLAEKMKKKFKKPIVFGGPQATFTAKRSMEICPAVDFVVLHEGERTVVELMHTLESGGNFSKIKGICYRDGNEIVKTPERPLIENLDDSPFPDFDALDIDGYLNLHSTQIMPYMPIDSGRGCPFKCTFCAASLMWKRRCRFKSSKRIVQEMDIAHRRYGVRNFSFIQDNFTTHRSFVLDVCNALNKRNYSWSCYSRSDALDAKLLDAMKKAGCNRCYFGIESASNRILKAIHKGVAHDSVERSTHLCRERGMRLIHAYILGFPDERESDIDNTLRSMFKSRVLIGDRGDISCCVLMPMPGTEITRACKDRLVSPYPFMNHLKSLPRYNVHPTRARGKHRNAIRNLVTSYSDVFSSDYFVKPKHLEVIDVLNMQFLYYFLISHFYRTTHLIFTHTSVKPLSFLKTYQRMNLPLIDRKITPSIMTSFFATILKKGRKYVRSISALHFIEDVLQCEIALFTLNRGASGKCSAKRTVAPKDSIPTNISGYRLSCTPSVIRHTFRYDILTMLSSIDQGKIKRSKLRKPAEYVFFHDAISNESSVVRSSELLSSMLDLAKKNLSLNQYLSRIDRLTGDPDANRVHILDLWQAGILRMSRARR